MRNLGRSRGYLLLLLSVFILLPSDGICKKEPKAGGDYLLGTLAGVPPGSLCTCDFSSDDSLDCSWEVLGGATTAGILWQNVAIWAGAGFPVGRVPPPPPQGAPPDSGKFSVPYSRITGWEWGERLSASPYAKVRALDHPWVTLEYTNDDSSRTRIVLALDRGQFQRVVLPTLQRILGDRRGGGGLRIDDALTHSLVGQELLRWHYQGNKRAVKGAIEEFRAVLSLLPDDSSAHRNLALALEWNGELDGALAEYQTVVRLLPNDAEAHLALAEFLHFRKSDLDGAVAEYRTVLRLIPKDNAGVRTRIGAALLQKGDYAGAVEEFRAAVSLQPSDAGAHAVLGEALLAAGDAQGALAEYRQAHQLDPKDRDTKKAYEKLSRQLKQK